MKNFEITETLIKADITNLGHASTSNATFHYLNSNGDLLWVSENFGVNATNNSEVTLNTKNLTLVDDGIWAVHYQKRVIDSSKWVEELIDISVISDNSDSNLSIYYQSSPAPSLFIYLLSILTAAVSRKNNSKY